MTGEPLSLSQIRRDGGTQPRVGLNEDTVAEYVEALREGASFPPVGVVFDGEEYWLYDGFHRLEAYSRAGAEGIPARVELGTQRDAVLASLGVNAEHGLRRSNEDKRRAVKVMLEDEEWREWSDREIARQCSVSQPFVSKLREELSDNVIRYGEPRKVKRGGSEYVQDTANIGKPKDPQPKAQDQQPQREAAQVWEVEQAIRKFFEVVGLTRPEDAQSRRNILEHLMERSPRDFVKYLPQLGHVNAGHIRTRDFKQARNNLLEQLRQQQEPEITPTLAEEEPKREYCPYSLRELKGLDRPSLIQGYLQLNIHVEQQRGDIEDLIKEIEELQKEEGEPISGLLVGGLEFPHFPGNPAVEFTSPGPTKPGYPKENRVEFVLGRLDGATRALEDLPPAELLTLIYSPAERARANHLTFEAFMRRVEVVREALGEYVEQNLPKESDDITEDMPF